MHIDHHFQARIVDELWLGERTFSELKPSGIENSLFMYHLRRLIARGIVIKTGQGYSLTPDGARWAHKLDHPSYRAPSALRTLVQLFIVRNGQLLISQRQGVTAKYMNRYLLPSALHAFGTSSEECANALARQLGTTRGHFMTQVETIMPSQQLHAISDIYAGEYHRESLPADEAYYHYTWISLEEVAAMSITEAGALPALTRSYLNGTLTPRQTLKQE